MPDQSLALLQALLGKPMRGQALLPGLYDPTGVSFEQPDGAMSSELGAILGKPGAYRLIPSLVPGQVDIQNILAGRKPSGSNWGLTPEQERIMNAYADAHASEVPTFKTVEEALAYEQKRHEGLDRGDAPTNPRDILSSLYMLLNQALQQNGR